MDIAKQERCGKSREKNPHAGASVLPSLSNNLWTEQDVQHLSTYPMQEMPAFSCQAEQRAADDDCWSCS